MGSGRSIRFQQSQEGYGGTEKEEKSLRKRINNEKY